jgi:hypothetical protein
VILLFHGLREEELSRLPRKTIPTTALAMKTKRSNEVGNDRLWGWDIVGNFLVPSAGGIASISERLDLTLDGNEDGEMSLGSSVSTIFNINICICGSIVTLYTTLGYV